MARATDAIPTAIVLAADATGLGAVWSLRRAGIPTIVMATRPDELALRSRFGRKVLAGAQPDPATAVVRALDGLDVADAVVVPTSDEHVRWLEASRAELEPRFRLCMPGPELTGLLLDKARETAAVAAAGLELPRTVAELPAEPDALIERLGLPLILKPRTFEVHRALGLKTAPLFDAAAVRVFYARHAAALGTLIAQELIVSADTDQWVCDAVFDAEHRLVAGFTFRKLAMSPAGFGVTTWGRSERNAELLDLTARLGRALGYTGPADLDFILDRRRGRYLYIELNPRVGMCNYFATACGVNCVAAAVRPGSGAGAAAPVQRDGVHLVSTVEHLYSTYHASGRSLRALAGVAGRLARGCLGPTVFLTGRAADPLPGLGIVGGIVGGAAANRLRRLRRAAPSPSPACPAPGE
jgi:predicted ATP-grasp superfamily ATP-dependent carboligase